MTSFRQDVRDALRRLRHDPWLTLLASVTLALGIGANTAMFSVIKTVLLKPLPYGAPEGIAMLWNPASLTDMTWLSPREVVNYDEASKTFDIVSGYVQANASLVGDEPERVPAGIVKHDLLTVLRVEPMLGRGFASADGAPGAAPTVLLGHGLWLRRFGGDARIVGQQILVNGTSRTVIGVMAPDFKLPLDYRNERATELWVPLTIDPANLGGWGNRSLIGVGRLAPGSDVAAASSELDVIGARWVAEGFVRDTGDGRFRRAAIPVGRFVTGELRAPLGILLGTVAVVLLIALANVANLVLARAGGRAHEIAVRSALGAGRSRLVTEMLMESVLLAALGGVLGLGLAITLIRVIQAWQVGSLPRIEQAELDATVLGFAALVTLLAGVAFGLAPALQLSRPTLRDALSDSGRGSTAGRGRLRLRRALIVTQVSLSVVLLLGAGLLTRSLFALTRIDPGFETRGILTAQVQLPAASYPDSARTAAFFERLEVRLREAPGVRASGGIRVLPLGSSIGDWSITIEGRERVPSENPNGDFQWATPGYFDVMGIRALDGRLLSSTDRADGDMAVVINDTMAARYWPGERAIGKRFHLGTLNQPWLTVVGVVPTVRHNALVEEARAEMYLAHAQVERETGNIPRSMSVVVRTDGDPRALVGYLREAVRALDPSLPISDIRTMEEVAARALAEPRLLAWLLGGFAGLALTLAAIGIYGTISLLVSDRSREIGIRLALGAPRQSVLAMVLSQGAALTGTGVAIGLAASFFLTRVMASVLYGVSTRDALTFAVAPMVLVAVALVASIVPARRASRLDPLETLRP